MPNPNEPKSPKPQPLKSSQKPDRELPERMLQRRPDKPGKLDIEPPEEAMFETPEQRKRADEYQYRVMLRSAQ